MSSNTDKRFELLRDVIEKIDSLNRMSEKIKYLQSIDDREFEFLVAELYAALGYNSMVTQASNDEGKDVIAIKDGKKTIIECKKYGSNNFIGREIIQKLAGAVLVENASKGIIIATNYFHNNAKNYLNKNSNNQIELVDVKGLIKLLISVKRKNAWEGKITEYRFDETQIRDWERNKEYILSILIQKLTIRHDGIELVLSQSEVFRIYPTSITEKYIHGIVMFNDTLIRQFKYLLKGHSLSLGRYLEDDEIEKLIYDKNFTITSDHLGYKMLVHNCIADRYNEHLFSEQMRYTVAHSKSPEIKKVFDEDEEQKAIDYKNQVIQRYNRIYKKKWRFKPKPLLRYTNRFEGKRIISLVDRPIIPYDSESAGIMEYV